MKTLIIYSDIESPLQFLIIDGDFSRFNGILINSIEKHPCEDEFIKWMFNEEGERNHLGQWSEDISLLENKEWDRVAICTFLP